MGVGLSRLHLLARVEKLHNQHTKKPKPTPHSDELARVLAEQATVYPPSKMLDTPGTIYVIGFGPYVKIGWTNGKVAHRVLRLQTAAPEPLVVYGELGGTIMDERALHARFAEYRLQGEWFRKSRSLKGWIEAGCPSPAQEAERKGARRMSPEEAAKNLQRIRKALARRAPIMETRDE